MAQLITRPAISALDGAEIEQHVARDLERRMTGSEIALTGIYEISKILTRPAKLESTLASVLNLLSSFMAMRRGTITLLANDGEPQVVVGGGWKPGGQAAEAPPQKALDSIVATGVPLVVQNVAGNPLFADAPYDPEADEGATVSFIGVPIRAAEKVIGILAIDRVWDGSALFRFDVDVRFLTMVANLIGQTIELHRVVTRDRLRLMEESNRLQKELTAFRPAQLGELKRGPRIGGVVGDSPAIRSLMDKIAIVAKSSSTVLLRGESGTGKELFAKAIHDMSPRAKGPFVKINCAALPESVLESELFGHEKGAFTGAVNFRKGRFELADHGTLFLDEIGEISPAFQAKLLRVLQEGEFDRVGGSRTVKVDVRVVAATNKNLEEAVAAGEFRADLYYRISVVPLMLPPLRDRKGDIPLLAKEFLKRFNTENARELSLSPGAVETLKACYFPGNVRELENCIRRTATLTTHREIAADDFACHQEQCLSSTLWKARDSEIPRSRAIGGLAPLPMRSAPPRIETPLPVAEVPVESASPCACAASNPSITTCPPPGGCPSHAGSSERERLIEAMEKSGWVQAKAARILGLTPRQIGYALRKHGIELQKF